MKAITADVARRLAKVYGLDISGNGRTFYAYSFESTELYEFDTKKERDDFVKRNKDH